MVRNDRDHIDSESLLGLPWWGQWFADNQLTQTMTAVCLHHRWTCSYFWSRRLFVNPAPDVTYQMTFLLQTVVRRQLGGSLGCGEL